MFLLANDSKNWGLISVSAPNLLSARNEGEPYHLQLILPKLLLLGLVEKGKLADMVDKDVSEDGQLGVERRHLPKVGLEGCAKPPQRRGGVELRDLPFDLLRDELAFQI